MDSVYLDPKPKCCDPFPGMNLSHCWGYDSTYCTTCGRWLEAPYDYIPRPEWHSKDCQEWTCKKLPTHCTCGHNAEAHGRRMRMGKKDLTTKDYEKIVIRFASGPHNCDKCECQEWVASFENLA